MELERLRGALRNPPMIFSTLEEVLETDLRDIIKEIIIRTFTANYQKPSVQVFIALKELAFLVKFVKSKEFQKLIEEEKAAAQELIKYQKPKNPQTRIKIESVQPVIQQENPKTNSANNIFFRVNEEEIESQY